MHFLLFYEYPADYLERREGLRGRHLQYAQEAVERGELILGGALADPFDTGVLLFEARSAEVVEEFARNDPYVTGGLVASWRVRQWVTVVGAGAASPA